MKFTSTLALFAAAALPSVFADTFNVTVGQGGPTFTPSTITAKVGDIVLFQFVAGDHSVTQAPFSTPCTQAWLDDTNVPGLDTGFVPVNGTAFPVVQVRVDSALPTWIFCQQAKHCNNGMVMVINPPADGSKTLAQFKANAATAPTPGYGHFTNFSATAAAATNGTGSTSKPSSAYSPKVLSGGLAAAALLISGLLL